MKNILIVILTLFIGLQVVAQETQQSENKVYSFVQQKASPKEGFAEFYQNFAREFVAPTLASNIHELAIKLKFVVEKDGSFSDIQIIDDKLNVGEEAMRVLKKMKNWEPAEYEGKIVRMYFILPINIAVN